MPRTDRAQLVAERFNQAVVASTVVVIGSVARYPGNARQHAAFGTERVPFTAEAVGAVDMPACHVGRGGRARAFAAADWYMEHLPKPRSWLSGHRPYPDGRSTRRVGSTCALAIVARIAEQVAERGTGT